ncbi:MAG: IS66 family insertion sequence element accessory protein TnpA, partial [Gemmatimonadota bacterium]
EVARRRWREDDARVVVEAWRQSGQSLGEFARKRDVHPVRLARWEKRLRSAGSASVSFHPVRLVQAQPAHNSADNKIELVLRAGELIRLPRGFAAEDLRQVLGVLAGRP